MLIVYDKLPKVIKELGLENIKTHLINNAIENINEMEQEITNKSIKQMKIIANNTVDYMEAVTGNKYGPQVFNNTEYLNKIEKYHLILKLALFKKIEQLKNIDELIALLQIKTIPLMIQWDVNEAVKLIKEIFKQLGYSKKDYSIETFFETNDLCDIEITFIKNRKMYNDYFNDGLLLTYNNKEGIRIIMKNTMEELIKYLGGNE
jgi:hypothetical protein